jgi:hypothetical protein
MLLYVRKSFMVFKIGLACIAFLSAIIALLGSSQNSFLFTQDIGKQLGVLMALVFGIVTIVEAFMAPPEAVISTKILRMHLPLIGLRRTDEQQPLFQQHA